jgi:hypothetical protein
MKKVVVAPAVYLVFLALNSCKDDKIGLCGSDTTLHEKSFKHNCITCHSIMNPNISSGGVTYVSIFDGNCDSIEVMLHRANKSHKEYGMSKGIFDSLACISKQ